MTLKPFALSVKVVVLDNSDRCLLLKRSMNCKENQGKWDLPGGKVDDGESFQEALLREVVEETGLEISLQRVIGTTESELPNIKVVFLIMEGYLESGQVQVSSEHDDYIWVDRRNLASMDLVDEFREIAEQYSKKEIK